MKRQRRALDGVLLLDKPIGLSAQQLVSQCRHHLNAEKAGHGGTLDPLATGLMVVAFGEATKFLAHQLEADKTYLATLRLGAATDSADLEGSIIARSDLRPSATEIAQTLVRFRGAITQVPPAHSAIKIDGVRAYELARKGDEVEMKSRTIHIHELSEVAHHEDELSLRVRCSKGTYIRSLARDIGDALGCYAHLSALRREGSGGFLLSNAIALEAVKQDTALLPADVLLTHMPALHICDSESQKLCLGQSLFSSIYPQCADNILHRVYNHQDKLLGVVSVCQGKVVPIRLIRQIV